MRPASTVSTIPSEPFLMPVVLEEHDAVAGGKIPPAALNLDRDVLAQLARLAQRAAGEAVEGADLVIGVGQNNAGLLGRFGAVARPAFDQIGARPVAGFRTLDHSMVAVGVKRFADAPAAELACGLLLPTLTLTADLANLDMAVPLGQRPKRPAGLDGFQLLGITDQNDLGAAPFSFPQHPFQLARADHAGFVDHQHVLGVETLASLRPLVLQAGDGARRDAGAAFEVLGRNARERDPAHPVAGVLPCLPRHREHRRLPGAGIADHDAEVGPVRDMGEGDDRAVLYGAFLEIASMLQGNDREDRMTRWRMRGSRAFKRDTDAPPVVPK